MTTIITNGTFEQYAESLGIDPATDDPARVAAMRKHFEDDRMAERVWPTVIPACPSWCIDPAGHDFDSWDLNAECPTFVRFHTAYRGPLVEVTAREMLTTGEAPRFDEGAVFLERQDDLDTPAKARSFASEVLHAADVLERIAPTL